VKLCGNFAKLGNGIIPSAEELHKTSVSMVQAWRSSLLVFKVLFLSFALFMAFKAVFAFVACPCSNCLGRDVSLSRQQVWRHVQVDKKAAADKIERCQQERLRWADNASSYEGSISSFEEEEEDDDRGEGGEDDIDWRDDRFYEFLKPYVESLVQGMRMKRKVCM
jgi:hypothetical protein